MLLLLLAISAAADTRLVDAVKNQNPAAARLLIEKHGDVNAVNAEGQTALYWAAHWGDGATADLLLKAGAKPNIASRYGLTPLSEAAQIADAAMIEKLLKAGANPELANAQGQTPLMLASRTNSVESVMLLLDHGAKPNDREKWRGETALMLAANEGNPEIVRLLLSRGADPNVRSASFDLQDRDGIVGLQSSLYWKGGLTALIFAARQGAIEVGQALVEHGADTKLSDTDFGFTPLMDAIFNGHLDFARMLIDKGANLNDGSLYLLIDQRGTIPNRGDKETVAGLLKLLLDRGADTNVVFNNGKVPPRVTYPAIRYGPIHAGSTPILAAARQGDAAMIQTLLDHHADPNHSTTVDHLTPLMAAAGAAPGAAGRGAGGRGRGGRGGGNPAAAVQLLAEHGADVNATNSRGMTAMHFAARAGNEQAIQFLASKGARLDVKDRIGRTPLDIANGVMMAVTGADGPPNPRVAGLIQKLMKEATASR